MLYISLLKTAREFPNKLAVNDMTYEQLIEHSLSIVYEPICRSSGIDVLFALIKAASINKPILVLPKENKEGIIIPSNLTDTFNLYLYSSGSIGPRTAKMLPESMIMANCNEFITTHNITEHDKILTVCSMNHTAGLTCQTLAGLLKGSHVIIEQFNPFKMLKLLKEYNITITHVVPLITKSLIAQGTRAHLPDLRFVCMGSDCITRDQVEYWLQPNREVMIVYGQTEAGPPILYHVFKMNDDLTIFNNGFPAGTKSSCDVKILNNELYVSGPNVFINGWYPTGDNLVLKDNWYYYTGRVAAHGKIIPKGKGHAGN